MTEDRRSLVRERLADKLTASLSDPLPDFTPRRIHGTVSLTGRATAVIGMRRAGKTTFLHQLRKERLNRGIPLQRLPYIDFEDELLAGMETRDLSLLLEEYYRRFPSFRKSETVTWCLDEIQSIPGWERFVRRLLDSEDVELFVSGSSAALLSREIATSMRGRSWEVVIFPFSFEEYLRHHGHEIPERPQYLTPSERSSLEKALGDYLSVGGFPEVQGLDTTTRQRVLSNHVDMAMFRDVVERHAVSNTTGLRWLVRHLLANAAGLFSVEKFYAALKSQGISISKDTVHELLAHLEDCFLIRTVWMEAGSERRRMVNPRKAYPIDPGLIPVYDRVRRANLGHALETAVFLELERRGYHVTYVRTETGQEVDFLARLPGGRTTLIQVCSQATDSAVSQRELRALQAAGRTFPDAGKLVLAATRDGLPESLPEGVMALPAYEWFLGAEE